MKLFRRKFGNIPQELKKLPQWVNTGKDNKTGLPNKVPMDPKTGRPAKANNPSTWGDYYLARDRYKEGFASGIGFEFSADDQYMGIDFDHCADVQGDIDLEVMAIIEEFNSYAGSSHTGVHIISRGKLPKGGCKKNGIEMYDQGRYFRMTGDVIQPFTEIRDCQPQINLLHEKLFGKNNKDDEILSKAISAKNGDLFKRLWSGDLSGYDSPSEADMALCDILSYWTKGDAGTIDRLFRQSKLMRPKWDEKRGGRTYGQMTIEKAINGGKESHEPTNAEPLDNGEAYQKILHSIEEGESGLAELVTKEWKEKLRFDGKENHWFKFEGHSWKKIQDEAALEACRIIKGKIKEAA